jgi:hypothetical protein
MNWFRRIIVKMAWPKVKDFLLDQIHSENYQALVVAKAEAKIPDTPGFGKDEQEKWLNIIYDASQEAAEDLINGIDIEKIVDKIG